MDLRIYFRNVIMHRKRLPLEKIPYESIDDSEFCPIKHGDYHNINRIGKLYYNDRFRCSFLHNNIFASARSEEISL